jgi:5-methylcytosine-specific restriction protein A
VEYAVQIIYRRITPADFFNINKPTGATAGGGGQTYIDFPTSRVSLEDWKRFVTPYRATKTRSGPLWEIQLHSIGLGEHQTVQVGQRRTNSVNIRQQRIMSKEANRVYAWDPRLTNFPKPRNPRKPANIRNLVVYLVRTSSRDLWAGWFHRARPKTTWICDRRVREMFDERGDGAAGVIYLNPPVQLDDTNLEWPFGSPSRKRVMNRKKRASSANVSATIERRQNEKSERSLLRELFEEDQSKLSTNKKRRKMLVSVLRRNSKIIPKLKALYHGRCQISGTKYVFKKKNGDCYVEAHHLVALGRGGADAPRNIIVVSPMIHRMLHHADVSAIDLQKIKNNKLSITINRRPYTIKWHPEHAAVVLSR